MVGAQQHGALNIPNFIFSELNIWGLRFGGSYQDVVEDAGLKHQQK